MRNYTCKNCQLNINDRCAKYDTPIVKSKDPCEDKPNRSMPFQKTLRGEFIRKDSAKPYEQLGKSELLDILLKETEKLELDESLSYLDRYETLKQSIIDLALALEAECEKINPEEKVSYEIQRNVLENFYNILKGSSLIN